MILESSDWDYFDVSLRLFAHHLTRKVKKSVLSAPPA